MLKSKSVIYFSVFILFVSFYGCSSSATSKTDSKIGNKNWSITDSEFITDSLVTKILHSKKIKEFDGKQKPIIIVGKIENLSTEKIDVGLLEKNIERSLLNSGKVTFITSKEKREITRNNRKTRNYFNSKKEFGKYLKPLKSDLFIDGKFELTIDSLNNFVSKKYQLSIMIFDAKNYVPIFSESIQISK